MSGDPNPDPIHDNWFCDPKYAPRSDPVIQRIALIIEPCVPIEAACFRAQEMADKERSAVEFDFNGVLCVAVPDGNGELLAERQKAKQAEKPSVSSK
jgi:hypothetical protein